MTALYCDPQALAGILRERQACYEFVARGSVGYYERTLDFGAWVAEKRSQCAHGVWMKTLRAIGWSYSICNRAIKLHKLGVSAAELARDGAKAVLKRFARPRRPAAAGEAKFSAGAKFEAPPTAPGPAEASAPSDEFEEPVPEGEDAAEPGLPLPEGEDAAGDAGAVEAAWQTVRERLQGELGDALFKSWVKPCRIEKREAGAAVIAPTGFMCNRVRQDYGDRIRDLWKQAFPDMELDFGVGTAAPKAQRDLPLPGGRAAASTGNVTLAVSPKTAQGNAPALRLSAAAAAASDVRMRAGTRLMMLSFGWRYWPGRPWRGEVEELGALTGLKRSAAYDAFNEAVAYGHLHSDSASSGRRTAWWPVVEIAAETDWRPPEQFELNFRHSLDRTAVDYLARFSGLAAYG